MNEKEQRFLQRLLVTFKIEADEHLKTMSVLLPQLEQASSAVHQAELIETLFREVHSLKGAARSVNLAEIEAGCQEMERIFAALKQGEIRLAADLFDSLYQTLDRVQQLLASPSDRVVTQQSAQVTAPQAVGSNKPQPGDGLTRDTVRISTAKLETLLNQAEALHALKFSTGYLATELASLQQEFAGWRKAWGKVGRELHGSRRSRDQLKYRVEQSRQFDKLTEWMMRDEVRVREFDERLLQLSRAAQQEHRSMTGMIDNLLDDMKQALMLPFSTLLELFPKLVRDLARDSAKSVELEIEGAAIEIDRRILEQMKDPLIHLLRNAIDHGIESRAVREQNGKPVQGRIVIAVVLQDGNKIELTVTDDGAGIRHDRIREVAERNGLLKPGQPIDDDALASLVFESGFSTSPILTDISGRGLGLAIVAEKVEKLGGRISVESQAGVGTCFRIILPAALATFCGVLVVVGDRQFVLPSASVERVARVPHEIVRTVENRETITIDDQAIALVWLSDVLGLPRSKAQETHFIQVVLLGNATRRIAFVVDEVVANQEVLVKPLGPQLQRVRNVSAATVLGAGRLVPILNVADLLLTAIKVSPSASRVSEVVSDLPQHSLLVAEDSVTSRSLFKNILETAGYKVTTAVDGLDALVTLRAGQFDLVVSDVEMPRMDGFELTEKIRHEPKLKHLPVVLVTALDSREDREHGVDVGADAYIVKGSFDQGNLLEVIRRLL